MRRRARLQPVRVPPRPGRVLTDATGEPRGLRTVARDFTWLTLARAANLVLGAVAVVLATRLLGPAGYAQVAYATVLATLITAVSAAWTATAAARYGREELERRATLRHVSWNRLAISLPLLVLCCGIVLALHAAGALPAELGRSLVVAALAAGAALLLAEHLVNLLEAAGRMRFAAVALALRAALVAGVLAVVAAADVAASATLVVTVTAAGSAVVAVWLARPLLRVALWPPTLDRALARRMIAFSVPLIAFSASQYGMRSVDIVILRAFEDPPVVGAYAAAFQAFVMLSQFATTITIVLTPLFVSMRLAGRLADVRVYLERLLAPLSLAIGLIGCVAAPAAAVLVPIVLGHEYDAAADPIAILTAALVLLAIASLAAPVLTLYERTPAIAAANVAALAVNAVADVVLIGALALGASGPAVATAMATAVIAGAYCVVAARCTGAAVRVPASALLATLAGVAAALALPGIWALPVACGVALAILAGARRSLTISSADAELARRLGIPAAATRVLGRLLGSA